MINKDYILRLAEKMGRAIAIALRLREADKHEDALIYLDDLFLKTVGLTSRFINSVSEDVLLHTISPLGGLNTDACLWIAVLLKTEGDIYADQGKESESYYRYLKSLRLYLEAVLHERSAFDAEIFSDTNELIQMLEPYELPATLKQRLFPYYELVGKYARAEDLLFELLESGTPEVKQQELLTRGEEFYHRLLAKSEADLEAGNLSHEEANEGLVQLRQHHS